MQSTRRACWNILAEVQQNSITYRRLYIQFSHFVETRLGKYTLVAIIIIMIYFRQKPIEHKKAMNNKTERQTEYQRIETATPPFYM